jgi:hypothetical protein
LGAHRPADLPRDVFPELVTDGALYVFELEGFRCAVDSEERLELLRVAWASGVVDAGPLAEQLALGAVRPARIASPLCLGSRAPWS